MPQSNQSAAQTQTTIIGPDTHLSGTLSFEGGATILGKIDGKIIGTGEVTIGQQAQCRATIEGNVIAIDGNVEGNILAKDRVLLNSGSRVIGDIIAEALTISPGATFQGAVRIGVATAAGQIESKSTSGSSTTELVSAEGLASTANGSSSKPASLGAGLSSLGTPRASWPNQR